MGRGEHKFCKNGHDHMTKMAATIHVKTFKMLLLQNRKSYDLKTCRAALGTQALQSMYNGDPGLTLTYFTARSNLVAGTFECETLLQSN